MYYCYNCKNPYKIIQCNNGTQYICNTSPAKICWKDRILLSDNKQIYYFMDFKYDDYNYRILGLEDVPLIKAYIDLSNIILKINCFIPLPLSENKKTFSPIKLFNKLLKMSNLI